MSKISYSYLFLILMLVLIFALGSCGSPVADTIVTRIDAPSALQSDSEQPLTGIETASPEDDSTSIDSDSSAPSDKPKLEPTRISFLAAGDNVIHPCIYMDAERRADETTR